MSQSSFSFAVSSTEARFTNALLVRDVDGQYRVASADEVLSQAWGVLANRVKPGDSPRAARPARRTPPAWVTVALMAGLPFIHWNDSLKDLEYPLPELRARDKEIRGAFGESSRRVPRLPRWSSLWRLRACRPSAS